MQLDGGFAGLFRLDFAPGLFARNYVDPVLVACTDGVGTKLKVACAVGKHDSVGIDLVAMCVNDAICCGAEPLFFLDYVAMSHDDPPLLEQIVSGIELTSRRTGYRETRAGQIPPSQLTPSAPGKAVVIEWMVRYEF